MTASSHLVRIGSCIAAGRNILSLQKLLSPSREDRQDTHPLRALRLCERVFICLRPIGLFPAVLLAAGSIALGQTTKVEEVKAPEPSFKQLSQEASHYEKAGNKLKAAAAYEQIVALEPARRGFLAHRLARLYAESSITNKALEWAAVVAKQNPDPEAYTAGIHTILGDLKAAEDILVKAIGAGAGGGSETNAVAAGPVRGRKRMMLQWQLADIYEKAGDAAKAEKALKDAAEAAETPSDTSAAQRRLADFQKRHPSPDVERGK